MFSSDVVYMSCMWCYVHMARHIGHECGYVHVVLCTRCAMVKCTCGTVYRWCRCFHVHVILCTHCASGCSVQVVLCTSGKYGTHVDACIAWCCMACVAMCVWCTWMRIRHWVFVLCGWYGHGLMIGLSLEWCVYALLLIYYMSIYIFYPCMVLVIVWIVGQTCLMK